jgi:hypothetical protein
MARLNQHIMLPSLAVADMHLQQWTENRDYLLSSWCCRPLSKQTAAELAAGMLATAHSIQHVLQWLLQQEASNTTSSSSSNGRQQQQQQAPLLDHTLWLP